jgi:hypothetical protein
MTICILEISKPGAKIDHGYSGILFFSLGFMTDGLQCSTGKLGWGISANIASVYSIFNIEVW